MTKTPPPNEQLRFDVHPSVVFKLGEDLITDEVQALLELVKNSYDAKATYAHIEIDTLHAVGDSELESFYPKQLGWVRITDNGIGMARADVASAWMVVSNSSKRKEKELANYRSGQRVPLGDKGLGRLGAQRIARTVELFTGQGQGDKIHVGFKWFDFTKHERLSDVPIRQAAHTSPHHGTVLLLGGLVEPARWRDVNRIQERLAELVSPFAGVEKFQVVVSVDGAALDLHQVSQRLRREADASFTIDFDGTSMATKGRVKLRSLEPSGVRRRAAFQQLTSSEGDTRLVDALKQAAERRGIRLRRAKSEAWFVEFEQTLDLDEIAGVELSSEDDDAELDVSPRASVRDDSSSNGSADESSKPVPVSPGAFRAEIDSFSLDPRRVREQEAFSAGSEYRDYIKRMAGVRVFRDGFGVRVDRDFLGLAKQWTTGRSWYGLRPANTIGFIALTARENMALVETTDREGFKDTAAYRNFQALLREFVTFTAVSLELLRREVAQLCAAHGHAGSGASDAATPETVVEEIALQLEKAAAKQKRMSKAHDQLALARQSLQSVSRDSLSSARSTFSAVVSATEKCVDDLDDAFGKIIQVRDRFELLRAFIEQFNERLAQAYDLMGLGLTTEAFAHEVRHIADGVQGRTTDLARGLATGRVEVDRIQAYVRHVKAALEALRKQLARLDPSLRYVRERREQIRIVEFLEELVDYHKSRWRDVALTARVVQQGSKQFVADTNRGKLTQIFDNLILNSDHWLREDVRVGRIKEGEIRFEVKAPLVRISDNGRGISPKVEGSLFDAFVTAREGGRGLGLFLVREFLRAEGCDIRLIPTRNAAGRFFGFELDLSGMVPDE